ncbi:MAG: hypothetical protein ACYC56_05405 [Candidatus Aquicultor sp.]
MWDVEPNSYPGVNSNTQSIIDYTVSNVKPGSIILLHPFGSVNKKTREAIPGIITALQKRGHKRVQAMSNAVRAMHPPSIVWVV